MQGVRIVCSQRARIACGAVLAMCVVMPWRAAIAEEAAGGAEGTPLPPIEPLPLPAPRTPERDPAPPVDSTIVPTAPPPTAPTGDVPDADDAWMPYDTAETASDETHHAPAAKPIELPWRTPGSPWLRPYRLGGMIGGGIGIAALVVGVWQGNASWSARVDFTSAQTQVVAFAAKRRGEVAAERANAWFLAGGILTAAGVTMFTLDATGIIGTTNRDSAARTSLTILPTVDGGVVVARIDLSFFP